MKKNNILRTILGFTLALSALTASACKGNKKPATATDVAEFDRFSVQASVDANYNTVFEIPEVVAEEGGKIFSTEITVSKRSDGVAVAVYNNQLLIEDLDGYTVRYVADCGAFSQTKEMVVNVVDTLAPAIAFDGFTDAKVYTKTTTSFAIPVDKVRATDNLSNAKITYKVFKDGQEVVVFNDKLNVSEKGVYDVVFYATDANGNVAEKTLKVYSVDCDPSLYMDFETEYDTDKVYGNNMTANYLQNTRVRYDEVGIAKPANGGDYAVRLTPILNAMYPRYNIDFGKELPAGTKVSYQLYFEAYETPEKMFTVDGAENCMITSKEYKHNEWITVDAVLTAKASTISSYLHLALLDGYDTPAYNYPAGIKVFIDNVSVELVEESYYGDFTMVKDHIHNDSTGEYLSVSYEKCNIGGYEGMAFKMEAPHSNKISFDADAMAFLKVYAQINGYKTITAHTYTTDGKIALNTWTMESLPQANVWNSQTKTIDTLPEYFYILRNASATVYMYFEFA